MVNRVERACQYLSPFVAGESNFNSALQSLGNCVLLSNPVTMPGFPKYPSVAVVVKCHSLVLYCMTRSCIDVLKWTK